MVRVNCGRRRYMIQFAAMSQVCDEHNIIIATRRQLLTAQQKIDYGDI